MNESRSALWMVLGGVLLAMVLIAVATNGRAGPNPALVQQFAPHPPAPGEPTPAPFQLPLISLPGAPPELQQAMADARRRLGAGADAPALTPVASGARVRVQVDALRREGERLRVRGSVANTSVQPVEIPPGAFSFRDSAGTSYATSGTGGARLAAGEQTTFDLTVPLPPELGLTLILTIPPDPPLEQILIVEAR
jgi:hypothetical protein